MTSPIRLGVVGLGRHTFETWYNSLRWAPNHQIVTVVDIDPAKIERFRGLYNVPSAYLDYREAFAAENLDAVVIQIGHDENGDAIRAALEADLHVFVEKTPVATTAEADDLIELAQARGKQVMVGFNRRFMTSYVLAKQAIDEPAFGDVAMYQSQFHATPYVEDRFLINHVVHHLDLARWLLGELSITHVAYRKSEPRRQAFQISFESDSGTIGSIQAASTLDELYPMERLEVIGRDRNVVVDNVKGFVYNRPPLRKETFEHFHLDDVSEAMVWNPSHGYYPRFTNHGYEPEFHHFISRLAAGEDVEPSLADARRSLALVESVAHHMP